VKERKTERDRDRERQRELPEQVRLDREGPPPLDTKARGETGEPPAAPATLVAAAGDAFGLFGEEERCSCPH
jgi:hypothetical protein